MIPGLYGPLFQAGYVTLDVERATDLFRRTQGVNDWFLSPTGTLPTRGGGMQVRVALAWMGDTMIEIIGCEGGDDGIYRQILPRDEFAVRLHHIAFRLRDEAEWQAMLEGGRRHGYDLALSVETASTRAAYLDTRAALGHYVEYLYYFDEARSSLPHIPQNRPASREAD